MLCRRRSRTGSDAGCRACVPSRTHQRTLTCPHLAEHQPPTHSTCATKINTASQRLRSAVPCIRYPAFASHHLYGYRGPFSWPYLFIDTPLHRHYIPILNPSHYHEKFLVDLREQPPPRLPSPDPYLPNRDIHPTRSSAPRETFSHARISCARWFHVAPEPRRTNAPRAMMEWNPFVSHSDRHDIIRRCVT